MSSNMDINLGRMMRLLGNDRKYAADIKYDSEGLWSFTCLSITEEVCAALRSIGVPRDSLIVDATAGVGGQTISIASYFNSVIALEVDSERYKMLQYNLDLFHITNVKTINDHYQNHLTIASTVTFLDLPWGSDYKKYSIGSLRLSLPGYASISMENLINKLYGYTQYCVIKIPYNYDLDYLFKQVGDRWHHIWHKEYDRPNTQIFIIFRAYKPFRLYGFFDYDE